MGLGSGLAADGLSPGGGTGTVTSVTATNATIVVAGSAAAPTVGVGTGIPLASVTGAAPIASPTFTGTVNAPSIFVTGNLGAAFLVDAPNNTGNYWAMAAAGAATTLTARGGGGVTIQPALTLALGTKTTAITSGALPTVSPSSGTAFQCLTTRDVTLVTAVTATLAAGTATIQLSPDNTTFSTLGVSTPGIINSVDLVTLTVPAAWWVKLTLSSATVTCTYY